MIATIEGMKFKIDWQHTRICNGPYYLPVDKNGIPLGAVSKEPLNVKSKDGVEILRLYSEKKKKCLAYTVCTIERIDNNSKYWTSATAKCSSKDVFVKERGRLLSLERAASNVAFWFSDDSKVQKEIRTQFMVQYKKR